MVMETVASFKDKVRDAVPRDQVHEGTAVAIGLNDQHQHSSSSVEWGCVRSSLTLQTELVDTDDVPVR